MVHILIAQAQSSAPPSFAQSIPPVQNLGFHRGWSHCTAFNHLVSTSSSLSPKTLEFSGSQFFTFFFLFTFCCSSDLPFLGHLDKGEKCSDSTLNLQASPIFVDSLCFWWSRSCDKSALRNDLVDLGRSVHSDV